MNLKDIKKIKIGYLDYTLEHKRQEEMGGFLGLHERSGVQATIQVGSETQKGSELVNTVIHEMLHGVWDEYVLPKDDEERMVSILANGITGLMRDNKELFRELLRNLK